jgi:uncharacterized membrane protein YhfC
MDRREPFFSRRRALEGLQLLALTFSMLCTIFGGLDLVRNTNSIVTNVVIVGCAFSLIAIFWLTRRFRTALVPIFLGAIPGLLFLVIIWTVGNAP